MMTPSQPSDEELAAAWNDAIELEGQGDRFATALRRLTVLKNLRTTWYGEEENNLRRSIEQYLETSQC